MPLKKDPQNGGTESNGSKSKTYCSYCYHNGQFVFNGNLEEYKAYLKNILHNSGISKLKTWFFLKNLSRLDRWKSDKA